jgi:hypothetical protein
MQAVLMLLLFPPLLAMAAVFNGWKFRYFDRERYLLKYRMAARAAADGVDAANVRGLK